MAIEFTGVIGICVIYAIMIYFKNPFLNTIISIAILKANPMIYEVFCTYFPFLDPSEWFGWLVISFILLIAIDVFLFFLFPAVFVGLLITYFIGVLQSFPIFTYLIVLFFGSIVNDYMVREASKNSGNNYHGEAARYY